MTDRVHLRCCLIWLYLETAVSSGERKQKHIYTPQKFNIDIKHDDIQKESPCPKNLGRLFRALFPAARNFWRTNTSKAGHFFEFHQCQVNKFSPKVSSISFFGDLSKWPLHHDFLWTCSLRKTMVSTVKDFTVKKSKGRLRLLESWRWSKVKCPQKYFQACRG